MPLGCGNCLLTNGMKLNCNSSNIGGNQDTLYIAPLCYITSTAATNNVITSITMNGTGAVFYEVKVRRETVSATEDLVLPNNFINQTLQFTLSNLSDNVAVDNAAQEALDFARDLIRDGEPVVIITSERLGGGVKRIFGLENGMYATVAQRTTGLVNTDVAGNAITMLAGENSYAPVFSSSLTIPV